jgi:hypothetical protein
MAMVRNVEVKVGQTLNHSVYNSVIFVLYLFCISIFVMCLPYVKLCKEIRRI